MPDQTLLREAWEDHGEATCAGCGEAVDLSPADDIEEAKALWNEHVEDPRADTQQDADTDDQ